jgi:hypothetical protein
LEVLKPKDFFAQMLVKNYVDEEWEANRFKRHKALTVERRDRHCRELQAKLPRKDCTAKECKENEEKPATDSERLFLKELEAEDLGFQALKALEPSTELGVAQALEERIDYYERLDGYCREKMARKSVLFDQFQHYQEIYHIAVLRYLKSVEAAEGEQRMMEMFEHLALQEQEEEKREKEKREKQQIVQRGKGEEEKQ